MQIIEMKAQRQALWDELNALVSQDSFSRSKEMEIRSKIKDLQNNIAIQELTAYIKKREADLAICETAEQAAEHKQFIDKYKAQLAAISA